MNFEIIAIVLFCKRQQFLETGHDPVDALEVGVSGIFHPIQTDLLESQINSFQSVNVENIY